MTGNARTSHLFVLLSLLLTVACAARAPDDLPVVSLVGDSTVTETKGWGGAFTQALAGRAIVHNHAIGGRSAKSYTDEQRLPAALAVNPDFVLVQFGHNGQPGKGAHRETDPAGNYRDYLRRMVADIRAAGAEPIIVSSLTRRNFDAGAKIQSTLSPWAAGARAVADELAVPFVDLFTASVQYHNRIGPANSARFDIAPDDHTHLNPLGAYTMAGLIFDELTAIGHPLGSLRPADVYVAYDSPGVPATATIGEALALAPASGSGAYRIHLGDGRYQEKLVVDKPNVILLGSSQAGTIISSADSGGSIGYDGLPVGTRGSYTLKVDAPGFAARNLTIENAFDYEGNRARPDDDPARTSNSQGVALMLSGSSDRARFENVTFLGNQDTLFVNAGRSYFHKVRIVGHVDFIFGAGRAVFEESLIEALNRPGKNPVAYVAAPSTHRSQPFGFLFIDCRIVRHDNAVPTGSVKLGRPWHPNNDLEVNGSAVFMNCFMDDSVAADGYSRISGRLDGEQMWFDLEPYSRFFESGSHGPGAMSGPRRPQLEAASVPYYTRENVLGDWRPGADHW